MLVSSMPRRHWTTTRALKSPKAITPHGAPLIMWLSRSPVHTRQQQCSLRMQVLMIWRTKAYTISCVMCRTRSNLISQNSSPIQKDDQGWSKKNEKILIFSCHDHDIDP